MYYLIDTYNVSGGKGAKVRIDNVDEVLNYNSYNRTTQLGKVGDWSQGLYLVNLETFEEAFSEELINKMQENGILDYYPDGKKIKGYNHIYNGITDKYPIFKKEIYLKYGIKRETMYLKKQN